MNAKWPYIEIVIRDGHIQHSDRFFLNSNIFFSINVPENARTIHVQSGEILIHSHVMQKS
jgi:hypothetical protein